MLANVDVYGFYIAPFAADVVLTLVAFYFIRRVLARLGINRMVWHPNLFEIALFSIILCLFVMFRASG
jgi:protein AaeX